MRAGQRIPDSPVHRKGARKIESPSRQSDKRNTPSPSSATQDEPDAVLRVRLAIRLLGNRVKPFRELLEFVAELIQL